VTTPQDQVTCWCEWHNLPSPIGPMAKKTDKKKADKKDTGKKPNAGKDAEDSKVRCLASIGVDLGSMVWHRVEENSRPQLQ